MSNIGDAVTRIEHVAELVERQVRLVDMETLQSLLKNKEKQEESQRFPCHTLPVAENKKFFGRKDILREIEEHLRPAESSSGLKSLAMHGLGGVGKTQIALAYGYAKLDEIDAVFWIPAEQELALQQGFTKIAIEGLHLEGAKPQGHQENMLMVMNWLQHTGQSKQPDLHVANSSWRRQKMALDLRQRGKSPDIQQLLAGLKAWGDSRYHKTSCRGISANRQGP